MLVLTNMVLNSVQRLKWWQLSVSGARFVYNTEIP